MSTGCGEDEDTNPNQPERSSNNKPRSSNELAAATCSSHSYAKHRSAAAADIDLITKHVGPQTRRCNFRHFLGHHWYEAPLQDGRHRGMVQGRGAASGMDQCTEWNNACAVSSASAAASDLRAARGE